MNNSKRLNGLIFRKEQGLKSFIKKIKFDVVFHPSDIEGDEFYEARFEKLGLNCFGKTPEKAVESLRDLIFGEFLVTLADASKKK